MSMITVSDEDFEIMVQRGIDELPGEFAPHIQNVAITWADMPDVWQAMKAGLRRGMLLFGLYEGIPRTRRGNNYSMVLPDKITIFKRPLEFVSNSESELSEKVKRTVWHEVAHHFGLSDAEIHRREQSQTQ